MWGHDETVEALSNRCTGMLVLSCVIIGMSFSWHRHHIEGTDGFRVSSDRHWQSVVNGIAKVPKRSFPQWDSNPAGTVRSPVQALTHSTTARVEGHTMYHIMTCDDGPNCSWKGLAIPTPAGVNCAKHW